MCCCVKQYVFKTDIIREASHIDFVHEKRHMDVSLETPHPPPPLETSHIVREGTFIMPRGGD